jgi:hypothetical protein
MKMKLLLPLALTLASASSLMAQTVDVYITGSTAFRANVYNACTKLFTGTPSIYYANSANGGANSGFSAKTASWAMTGSPITGLTNLNGNMLTIHGLFTGSVQGYESVLSGQQLVWAAASGTANGNCNAYVTNPPTIGFSDASGDSFQHAASGNFAEENVCVQPFVIAKSTATSGAVTTISNITWEQFYFGIPNGGLPLSTWTGNVADTNSFVYLLQRTSDSGTRRTETAGEFYQFTDPVNVYLYDYTNNVWYTPTNTSWSSAGQNGFGVIGTEGPGNNNANLNWGPGYIGGGDIATSLNNNNPANQALAYLSISDAKGVGSANWNNLISYNGIWPTAAGAGIHGNSGTNDFSPITSGFYPLWGYEVLVHPIDPSLIANQGTTTITANELGNQTTAGSFLGVFNAQTLINGGSPLPGSIENEIQLSKPGGATAIRLSDMISNRSAVGGELAPF